MTDPPERPVVLHSEDDYEAKHMTDEGAAMLYRDKFITPWPWHALMGSVTALSLVAVALDPNAAAWIGALTAAITIMTWLLFAVLRVSVSTQQVRVQLGLFGPAIDVASITRCEAVEYDWKKFGGWGIRRAADGEWAYNMMGDAGQAVRIVYEKSPGDERSVIVTAEQPGLLADAVNRARALRAGGAARGDVLHAEEQQVALDFSAREQEHPEEVAEVAEEEVAR